MYRMQKIDARTTFMHWQIHKDGAADWRGMGDRLEVAVALGLDPITAYSASAPLPKHIDELMLAGFLRGTSGRARAGRRRSTSRCPRTRRSCSRATSRRASSAIEGPFGDHTGYYSPPEPFPVFHLTCMTMRRDAIYPSIVVGVPPGRGRLARQGDGAHLPAGHADDRPRDRRLRPAGGGRVPQLRDRLDPQGVPRARAQGDARDLGPRAC